ncbi:spermatogenesis-associated protein 7 homolog isoform X1 [Festucalex cinctus]
MGYVEKSVDMESRRSVFSGSGSSLNIRGHALKSSPFYPHSSSRVAQAMIKDHMMSHYRRIYSAKAVIDNSVPKSLTHSVKYSDRLRQERMRNGGRSQSAQSLSHRNSRESCYSAQSRRSVQSECRPYLCSRNSMHSSPGFSSSFHAKEVPSPSPKATFKKHHHHHHHRPHSSAELKFRSQEPSSSYLRAPGESSFLKAFRDPVKKTYSGDLMEKHSQLFTQDKPFTPKTLKSEKSSYLSSYRYYRAPQRAHPPPGCDDNLSAEKRFMLFYLLSCRGKPAQHTQELDEPPRELNKKSRQLAEDEHTSTHLITPKQQPNKSRDNDPFDYSTRFFLEGGNMSSSAEDDELMYLEFINDVTEDILSKGSVSDRVLNRVIQRHIDMNLHRLDEAKMRHLLDILRNNLDEPSTPSNMEGPRKKDLLDSLLVMPESAPEQVQAEEDNNLFCLMSERNDSHEACLEPELSPTPVWSSERSSQLTATEKTEEEEEEEVEEDYNWEEDTSKHVSNNEDNSEEDYQLLMMEEEEAGGDARHEELPQDRAEADADPEEKSKELEDLERRFSESLHVSKDAKCDTLDSSSELQTNTLASLSDDDDF